MECRRSPTVGERGPDMLTGVGIFELELTEDVRSCLGPAAWIGEVSGGGQFPMVYDESPKLGMLVLTFNCGA